ncbi:MAG TPA: hypothetical protein VJ044_07755 [Candidatus Hodarchaeales archaeon]|nr:hypothetical protein [Candidatus Hodarchaeales archaeon]
MELEALCRLTESTDWDAFTKELDELVEKEMAKYDSCTNEVDFKLVRERIRMIREIQRYPKALKELREA